MKTWKIWLAVLMMAASPGVADEHEVTDFDRFRLGNDCDPISLLVERLTDDASEIDLTVERIETVVRSRLRAARIYNPNADSYIYVNIGVSRQVFSMRLEFIKRVFDIKTRERGAVPTWNNAALGTHGDDASYILSNLAEYADTFIDEYLRVNDKACPPAGRQ